MRTFHWLLLAPILLGCEERVAVGTSAFDAGFQPALDAMPQVQPDSGLGAADSAALDQDGGSDASFADADLPDQGPACDAPLDVPLPISFAAEVRGRIEGDTLLVVSAIGTASPSGATVGLFDLRGQMTSQINLPVPSDEWWHLIGRPALRPDGVAALFGTHHLPEAQTSPDRRLRLARVTRGPGGLSGTSMVPLHSGVVTESSGSVASAPDGAGWGVATLNSFIGVDAAGQVTSPRALGGIAFSDALGDPIIPRPNGFASLGFESSAAGTTGWVWALLELGPDGTQLSRTEIGHDLDAISSTLIDTGTEYAVAYARHTTPTTTGFARVRYGGGIVPGSEQVISLAGTPLPFPQLVYGAGRYTILIRNNDIRSFVVELDQASQILSGPTEIWMGEGIYSLDLVHDGCRPLSIVRPWSQLGPGGFALRSLP